MLERVFRRDLMKLARLNSRYLLFAAVERVQDARLGIRTCSGLRGYDGRDGDALAGDATAARFYAPTPFRTLERLFDALPPDLSDYSFVDFGSGRGRALVLAAKRRFKQVIGVEFAKSLHSAAERNIAAAGVAHCTRSILCDARDFSIPTGPCVLFFFNPFEKAVMYPVAQNIALAVTERPRHVIVALYNETVPDAFDRHPVFQPLRTIEEDWFASLSHPGRYVVRLVESSPPS